MKHNKVILFVILFFGLSITMISCGETQAQPNNSARQNFSVSEGISNTQENLDPCKPNCFGTQIGRIIPPYTLVLSSNTTITSEELIHKKKPVFLFFYAKW